MQKVNSTPSLILLDNGGSEYPRSTSSAFPDEQFYFLQIEQSLGLRGLFVLPKEFVLSTSTFA